MNDDNPYAAPHEFGPLPCDEIAVVEPHPPLLRSGLSLRASIGGILGAGAALSLFAVATEFVVRSLDLNIETSSVVRRCFFALVVGGGVIGAICLGRLGGKRLPRWMAAVSIGALGGTLLLFMVASLHASVYQGKSAEPVQLAWLTYGGLPFLIGGAMIALAIDRRRNRVRA